MPGPDEICTVLEKRGYSGIDLGPVGFLGRDHRLRSRLEEHGLSLAGGWIDLPFTDADAFDAALPSLSVVLDVFDEASSGQHARPPLPTLADSGSDRRRANPGGGKDVALDLEGWTVLARNVATAAQLVRNRGFEPTFHHHACTYVETPEEIERFLDCTDVGLTLDTGHLILGGGDPLESLEQWNERVNHVHIKDARVDVLRSVVRDKGDMRDVWAGKAFVPLGSGDLDVDGFMDALLRTGYDGWLVVEQDSIPRPGDDPQARRRAPCHQPERHQKVDPVMTLLRIGVVGLGAVAQSVHLPLIKRRWDLFDLAAVADLSPTLLAQVGAQYGVPSEHQHQNLADMLDGEELDAVVLLTSGSHGGAALQCIEAGVAVFCEKPLAFSLAEIQLLRKAEHGQGRPMLLLGYMKEYDPAVLTLKERLPGMKDMRFLNVEVLHPAGSAQLAFANLRPGARDIPAEVLSKLVASDAAKLDAALGQDSPELLRRLYSGVILGSLIHDIALVRSLVGPLQKVDAVHYWAEQDEPGSIEISATAADGVRVHFNWHYLADYPVYRETVTVHHTTGSAKLEFGVPYLLNAPTTLQMTEKAGAGVSDSVTRDVTEAFEQELVAFHRMADSGEAPPTGIGEGEADVRVAQLIAAALAASLHATIGGEAASA
ncbi:TIM barrel protein [Pseudarthrobacter sp. Fe7]|nr:TIM barrel protein [Pseudarthrobacter sp. Fe7]